MANASAPLVLKDKAISNLSSLSEPPLPLGAATARALLAVDIPAALVRRPEYVYGSNLVDDVFQKELC